jgi:signal peptidase I
MQPNLWTGQILLVSRIHYLMGSIQYGDVAVFLPPGESEMLVKRVIGLPGDVIEVRDRQVYRNGILLDEPYFINRPCDLAHCPDRVWELGEDEYFLMGDNRNHSRDSRAFGPVTHDRIVGKAILRYWPINDFDIFFDQYNMP